MPASSSSSTSCQRLAWREPGAFVWASSSSSSSAGRRRERRVEVELLERARRGTRPPAAGAARALRRAPPSPRGRASPPSRPRRRRPRALPRARRLEHRVGLADARRGAEEDLEASARAAASAAASAVEQRVGIGPARHVAHRCTALLRAGHSALPKRSSSSRFSSSTLTRGSPRKPERAPLDALRPRAPRTSAGGHAARGRDARRPASAPPPGSGADRGRCAEVVTSSIGHRARRAAGSRPAGAPRRPPRGRAASARSAQVRARRRRRVVAVRARGRGPRLEVARGSRSAWPISSEPDDPAVAARPGCRWPRAGRGPARRRSPPAGRRGP